MIDSSTRASISKNGSTERSLLDRIAQRERDALAELYERYHARLFRFVYRFTRSHAESDELVNDIMLVVWNSAGKFRGDSKVSTWILGIAYRQSLRRLSRKQVAVVQEIDPDEFADQTNSVLEREDWVRNALDSLPAAQRLTLYLVFYAGLSYEEVARVTDCPVNTVKSRMFHARKRMKEQLECTAEPEQIGGGSE